MKKLSIIIPLYNEEKCIPIFWQTLHSELAKMTNYDFEIIFVDDGSVDKSSEEIKRIIEQNQNVKYLQFSRNFGKEPALSAGLHHSTGECAIMIDADLQHPPALIKSFIKKWEDGFEVVIGVRKSIHETDLIKKAGSWLFYKIMNQIGETKIAPRATDFRLIDKIVINEFKKITENNRITRGLIAWLGFKRDFIYFDAGKRIIGQAKYNKAKLFHLAISSFINHSLFPLRLAGYLGVFIMGISGVIGLNILIYQYILNIHSWFYFSGIAQLAIMIIFLVGLILSCLGLMALYIANIQKEVLHRPLYVIRERINL